MDMMLRKVVIPVVMVLSLSTAAQQPSPATQQPSQATPDVIYGELFADVQVSGLFPDGKTFVDCVPRRDPAAIVKDYLAVKRNPAIRFALDVFIRENFDLPPAPSEGYKSDLSQDITTHIRGLWKVLHREADKTVPGSSLIPLPHAYVVPGGRFREIYYWDSYFTMLGLKESGEVATIQDMVDNFAFLIQTYGHIPNGNRTYYLSRSQPPFFAMMVELLASIKGDGVFLKYLPAMEKEYAYWMEGADKLFPGKAEGRVVKLKDGTVLNRYWDENNTPRQESYREDVETARRSGNRNTAIVYRHLRAGAASGWDFSSRWLADKKNLHTIETADIIPVDLNSLLYQYELVLARARVIAKDNDGVALYEARAEKRRQAIDKYCWNNTVKYYTDYNFRKQRMTNVVTPAGLFPFCFFPQRQGYLSVLARQAATVVQEKLLRDGGLQSSEFETGQQWDAPNGWAPLQWMAVTALARSGQIGLAKEIARRWLALNEKVYKETGKLMEKYNVADLSKPAGGGEYAAQDGFGWTNGVYLALQSWLKN